MDDHRVSAGVGITDALSMPAFLSIVPSIVARSKIGRGLALNSTQFNLSRILGPSIAGVLISSVGAIACFAVSAVSYIPFIAVALWVLPPRKSQKEQGEIPAAPHPRHRPFAGFVEILRQRDPRTALLSVFATGALCGPLVTFTPVLVRDGFHRGASAFSVAVAAFGVGGLLGALGLLSVTASVDRRRLTSGFAVASGILLVIIALTRTFWVLPALIALAGAALTICTITANSFLETTARERSLGQTVSLYLLAMRGGISLGAVMTGLTVVLVGVQHALLLDGLLAVLVQVGLTRMWSRLPPPMPLAP